MIEEIKKFAEGMGWSATKMLVLLELIQGRTSVYMLRHIMYDCFMVSNVLRVGGVNRIVGHMFHDTEILAVVLWRVISTGDECSGGDFMDSLEKLIDYYEDGG